MQPALQTIEVDPEESTETLFARLTELPAGTRLRLNVPQGAQALRTSDDSAGLPKGMSPETLSLVTSHLRGAGAALSASEVASQCGLSRVTARRYLEHLEGTGVLERRPRYGGTGRPEVEYRWR